MSIPTTNINLVANSASADLGINNTSQFDPTNFFVYNRAQDDVVYHNDKYNSWVVLGRDRISGLKTGYGGQAHLKSGAIDLVVGRLGAIDARKAPGPVDPNPGADASRVYLSQKCDIDWSFKLPEGKTNMSVAQSAALIKADAVRLVARESMKLVTYTDSVNSLGFKTHTAVGVQLITKNKDNVGYDDMEPIPKGKALSLALEKLTSLIDELNAQVTQFLKLQTDFNVQIANHTHFSPFWGQRTSFDPEVLIAQKQMYMEQFSTCEQGLRLNSSNLYGWVSDYLSNPSSPIHINSKYHCLN